MVKDVVKPEKTGNGKADGKEHIVKNKIEDWGEKGPGWDVNVDEKPEREGREQLHAGREQHGGHENRGPMSKFSILLYLNDENSSEEKNGLPNMQGGATLLFGSSGGSSSRGSSSKGSSSGSGGNIQTISHRVKPKAGGALFFRHGFGSESVFHAGEAIQSGKKYVVRLQVLYRREVGRREDEDGKDRKVGRNWDGEL